MKLSLKILRKLGACESGIDYYKNNQECESVEIAIEKLLASEYTKKYNWTNWLISNMLSNDNKIRYAIFAAESVLDLFENGMPKDDRPRKAIEAAKNYLSIKNTAAEDAAGAAARAAARAAWAAEDAAGDAARAAAWAAAWAAWAAEDAAGDAARAAAWAAWAAEDAAGAAEDAAGAAAGAAARAAWGAGDAGAAAYNEMITKIIENGLSLIGEET
jgi:hypothetical protein